MLDVRKHRQVETASILLLLIILCSSSDGSGQFYGGSISNHVTTNTITGRQEVTLEVITSWTLGKGPCGPACGKSDIGKSTLATRRQMETMFSNKSYSYFGSWTDVYKRGHLYVTRDINTLVTNNMTEMVLDVDEKEKWEQEYMKFTIELEPSVTVQDIIFEGETWRKLFLQRGEIKWNLRTNIDTRLRSDTGKPNNSPRVLFKPVYRIPFNQVTTFHIAAIDKDGDHVTCSRHDFGHIPDAPGVSINKNCTITIDASEKLGYMDGTMAALAIFVRDYNTKEIIIGTDKMLPVSFSLSSTSVQFLVDVVKTYDSPQFVSPTLENNHRFSVYIGATWNTNIYAKASVNRTIDEFVVFELKKAPFRKNGIKNDSSRSLVFFTHLSWTPTLIDIGNHLMCTRVVDSFGFDSQGDKCFLIEVKANIFNYTHVVQGIPYFIDLVSVNETVPCLLGATCVFPVYIKSKAEISGLKIVEQFVDVVYSDTISQVTYNGEAVYKVDVAFRNTNDGLFKICLVATDVNSVSSQNTCVTTEIIPKDPCLTRPCVNSGLCTRSESDPADYQCTCSAPYITGKDCSRIADFCSGSPCVHGKCLNFLGQFYCYCQHGYTGETCDININDCIGNQCNGSAICKDGIASYTCDCLPRYNGTHCENDACPSANAGSLTCGDTNVCTARKQCLLGQCFSSGNDFYCNCPSGYTGHRCDKAIRGPSSTNVSFVTPSPKNGSIFICHYVPFLNTTCIIPVFAAYNQSSLTAFKIQRASKDIENNSTVTNIHKAMALPGIHNFAYTSGVVINASKTKSSEQSFICVTVEDSISSDHLCMQIDFVSSPLVDRNSQESLEKNRLYKFVEPTPVADSVFLCEVGKMCSFILYTTHSGNCQEVMTPSTNVLVYPVVFNGACVTKVAYLFDTVVEEDVCFLSSPHSQDSQSRCFHIKVIAPNADPCQPSPCQNDGQCFYNGTDGYTCACQTDYTRTNCEHGPCQPKDNICAHGYCSVDDHVQTCICPVGYSGQTCDVEIPVDISVFTNEMVLFADMARPSTMTCIRNRPCSVSLVVSRNASACGATQYQTCITLNSTAAKTAYREYVKPGYISPAVSVKNMEIEKYGDLIDTYLVKVEFLSKLVGMQDACIQSFGSNGVNQDEICMKLDVTTDMSTAFSTLNMPHFTSPSLPTYSHVRCAANQMCRVIYNVKPGTDHETDCVDVEFTTMPFSNGHIFSSCQNCTPGVTSNQDCHIDVSFLPTTSHISTNSTVCLQASLRSTGVIGEERCFNVSVQTSADFNVERACQLLHCQNGGFCDSHGMTAVCFCPLGFSGDTCDKDEVSQSQNATPTMKFVSGARSLREVVCQVNEACTIPFHIMGNHNVKPKVTFGYVSPAISAHVPVIDDQVSASAYYSGSATVVSAMAGKFVACLQTRVASLTADEMCISLDVHDTASHNVDKTRPHFKAYTPPDGSTVVCTDKSNCHLVMSTNKTQTQDMECPTLKTATQSEDMHIFTSLNSKMDCHFDVLYRAPPGINGTTKLCLQVSIPGQKGEERCYMVEINSDSPSVSNHSPCVGKSCENGGNCIADMMSQTPTPTCHCLKRYSGDDCSIDVHTTTTTKAYSTPSTLSTGYSGHRTTSSLPTGFLSATNGGQRCFVCEDMSHPKYCDVIKTCKANEICYVEQVQTAAGVSYRSGCMDSTRCMNQQHATTNSKDVCIECCHKDFCNNEGCGETGFSDVHARGPVCLDCLHVGSPDECHRVSFCRTDQICSIEEHDWGDESLFKLGCTDVLCNRIARSVDVEERSVPSCHNCCNTDYCNTNCTQLGNGISGIFVG